MTAPYLQVPHASHLHVVYGHIVYLKEDQNRKPTTSGGLCRCTNQAATPSAHALHIDRCEAIPATIQLQVGCYLQR